MHSMSSKDSSSLPDMEFVPSIDEDARERLLSGVPPGSCMEDTGGGVPLLKRGRAEPVRTTRMPR